MELDLARGFTKTGTIAIFEIRVTASNALRLYFPGHKDAFFSFECANHLRVKNIPY